MAETDNRHLSVPNYENESRHSVNPNTEPSASSDQNPIHQERHHPRRRNSQGSRLHNSQGSQSRNHSPDSNHNHSDNYMCNYNYSHSHRHNHNSIYTEGYAHRIQRRLAVTAAFAPFDQSYHPKPLHLYSNPRQRQRWGDRQILPRLNWGDLFFDLFYVAATYNTSNILVDAPSAEGLLYFFATFVSVKQIWHTRMVFDGCYVVGDDLYHRFLEVLGLCVLACAVVHIRTVDVMSNPTDHIEPFAFCISIATARLVMIVRHAELYLFCIGDPAVKRVAVRDILYNLLALVFLAAATVVSGLQYFRDHHASNPHHHAHDNGQRLFAGGAYYTDRNSSESEDVQGYDRDASSPTVDHSERPTNHIPIWLVIAAFLGHFGVLTGHVLFFYPQNGEHKKYVVPMNVDFSIHRYGEWTMLMLGESVLSILIVDVPKEDGAYFATFYCGLMTVALLHYLHFRSQPHHADGHALRRKKEAGISFAWCQFLYSISLIALGTAYTIFLSDFSHEQHRRLTPNASASRSLAGSTEPSKYSYEDMRERGAVVFSVALAVIFVTLDVTSILHVGIQNSKKRCVCRHSKKQNIQGYVLILMRCVVIVLAATLFTWLTNVEELAEAGLAMCVFQIFLRLLGNRYFPDPAAHHSNDRGEHEIAGEVAGTSIVPEGPWQDAAKLVMMEDDSSDDDVVDDADATINA